MRKHLPDRRDPRGRKHDLVFAVASIALALVAGCQSLSSVQRFIRERIAWLRCVTGVRKAVAISRTHLPWLIARIDWQSLDVLIQEHFGQSCQGWLALDGKAFRGSSRDEPQSCVYAVEHGTASEVARRPQCGDKEAEVLVARELLTENGLAQRKLSMDALHCNPETLGLIAQAGGSYLVQVKGNQPQLQALCLEQAVTEPELAKSVEHDKGHGRITKRTTTLVPLRGPLDPRWKRARLRYIVHVVRETWDTATGRTRTEAACYVTNAAGASPQALVQELARAVRGHWSVESNNWVRDATFGEDGVRAKQPAVTQGLALCRSLALAVLRKAKVPNLRALMQRFQLNPEAFAEHLKHSGFL